MTIQDLPINSYQISYSREADINVTLERCSKKDKNFSWAIREFGSCLSKDDEWVFEPSPSERDSDFLQKCRFTSPEEALTFWLNSASKKKHDTYMRSYEEADKRA